MSTVVRAFSPVDNKIKKHLALYLLLTRREFGTLLSADGRFVRRRPTKGHSSTETVKLELYRLIISAWLWRACLYNS